MNKRKIFIYTLLLALAVCLWGCGKAAEVDGIGKQVLRRLEEAGSYRGVLVLDTELGIDLDAEGMPEGLSGEVGSPVIRRTLTLDVMENLDNARVILSGKAVFSDALGTKSADVVFSGEQNSFFLHEEGENWGAETADGRPFLAFFRNVLEKFEMTESTLSDGATVELDPASETQSGVATVELDPASETQSGVASVNQPPIACHCLALSLDPQKDSELLRGLADGEGLTDWGDLADGEGLSAKNPIPVKLYLRVDDSSPLRIELDALGFADGLAEAAFRGSWTDGACYQVKSCTLSFTWTSLGDVSEDDIPKTPENAAFDGALPDSLLPALLSAGSKALQEKLDENLDVLESVLAGEDSEFGEGAFGENSEFGEAASGETNPSSGEAASEEANPSFWEGVPGGENPASGEEFSGEEPVELPPEDDVEEIPDESEGTWQDLGGYYNGVLTLSLANVGSAAISVTEEDNLLGKDESMLVLADSANGTVEYYLEDGISLAEAEANVHDEAGYSQMLGYRDVTIGPVQQVTVNGQTYSWCSDSYTFDFGEGILESCFEIHAFKALGGGILWMHITFPCATIEAARATDPNPSLMEYLGRIRL